MKFKFIPFCVKQRKDTRKLMLMHCLAAQFCPGKRRMKIV